MAQEPENQRVRRRPVRKSSTAAEHRGFSTLDERDYWIHRLLNLSVRQGKPWGVKAELTAALNGHPVFAPLQARLEALTPPPESTPETEADGTVPARLLQFRSETYELIHQALRIIEAQPLLVLGESLRAEVDAAVQNRLWTVFKYVAPTILVLIFGGSIYGYVHFQGISQEAVSLAQDAKKTITERTEDTKNASMIATAELTAIKAVHTKADQEVSASAATLQDLATKVGKLATDAQGISNTLSSQATELTKQAASAQALEQKTDDLASRTAKAVSQVAGVSGFVATTESLVPVLTAMPQPMQDWTLGAVFRFALWQDILVGLSMLLALIALGFSIWNIRVLRRTGSTMVTP